MYIISRYIIHELITRNSVLHQHLGSTKREGKTPAGECLLPVLWNQPLSELVGDFNPSEKKRKVFKL